jgi:hypothetical protein
MLKQDIRQGQQKKVMTTRTTNTSYKRIMSKLMQDCRNEANKDKRIEILNCINSNLLKPDQLNIPPQVTNEYVSMTLHKIEERLFFD